MKFLEGVSSKKEDKERNNKDKKKVAVGAKGPRPLPPVTISHALQGLQGWLNQPKSSEILSSPPAPDNTTPI
eukprot:2658129-Pyramimonas_sp.AAC.1